MSCGSGGVIPSRIDSSWPCRMASGVRNSWAISAANAWRSSSSRSTESAIPLNARASWPISSAEATSARRLRLPAASSSAAAVSSASGRVVRRATTRPTASATAPAMTAAMSSSQFTEVRNWVSATGDTACGTCSTAVPTCAPFTVIGTRIGSPSGPVCIMAAVMPIIVESAPAPNEDQMSAPSAPNTCTWAPDITNPGATESNEDGCHPPAVW